MRGLAVAIAVMLASWAMPAAAQKLNMTLLEGACGEQSNIADRSARRPFHCDTTVMTAIDPAAGDLLLIFLHKAGSANEMIAFGGTLGADGNLRVDSVQYEPGTRLSVNEGSCQFIRKGRKIKSVRCSATTGRDDTLQSAEIEFEVTGETKL